MTTNPADFEPLKKFMATQGYNEEFSEELMANIKVARKDDMFLYNYRDGHAIPYNHLVLMKCRGLVLDKKGKALNFAFERFFNYWQKECAKIDWNSAILQHKEDGSCIFLFFHNGEWQITTRGSFYDDSIPKEQRHDLWFKELFERKV